MIIKVRRKIELEIPLEIEVNPDFDGVNCDYAEIEKVHINPFGRTLTPLDAGEYIQDLIGEVLQDQIDLGDANDILGAVTRTVSKAAF